MARGARWCRALHLALAVGTCWYLLEWLLRCNESYEAPKLGGTIGELARFPGLFAGSGSFFS